MTERDDIDMLAGEFVLGTLDARERASVAARRMREPALEAAIERWEARLHPLIETIGAVAPPADMLARIEAQLNARARPSMTGTSADVIELQQRVTRWRRVALTASAMAASLAMLIGVREFVYPPEPQRFVGVFVKDDTLPQFVLTIDLKTRQLTVRPVGATREAGKSYQLWIASDQLGAAPRSLGLMDAALTPTTKRLNAYEPALLQQATFGVSIEPEGGSPTGRPSGQPLHTKLLPAAP
jgi:anti-sigma-K factor RskA